MSEGPSSDAGYVATQALYVNGARIDYTRWDMTVDLLLVTPAGEIPAEPGHETGYAIERMTRIVMSPMHAKALAESLGQAVKTWEKAFGPLPQKDAR